jgi:CBS domain containing-hemolysin-like protein
MTLTGLAAIPGLLAVIGLVLLNAFFVATEFAIVAVRRSRLRELAAGESKPARTAESRFCQTTRCARQPACP